MDDWYIPVIDLNKKSPAPMLVLEVLIVSLLCFVFLPFWLALRVLRR